MLAQKKIWNFSAGPSILPPEILLKAQSELLSWQGKSIFTLPSKQLIKRQSQNNRMELTSKIFLGCGVSVLEMSHRSKEFESIRKKAEQDLRDLLSIPQNYKVLFLQGGATLEFASIPMNLFLCVSLKIQLSYFLLLQEKRAPTIWSPVTGRKRLLRRPENTARRLR
jgi:phosphoserine aminotransferase